MPNRTYGGELRKFAKVKSKPPKTRAEAEEPKGRFIRAVERWNHVWGEETHEISGSQARSSFLLPVQTAVKAVITV